MSYRLRPVFGGMMFGRGQGEWVDDEAVQRGLTTLKDNNVKHIDTAQLYGNGASESCLGRVSAPKAFTIDTKWLSGWAESAWASQATIVQTAKESLDRLQTSQVDIFYLHSPDNDTPYEDTLKGINQAHQNGYFLRFGISNFSTTETQRVIDICKTNNYVPPTVYQGSYSAAARGAEDELVPLLRANNISFYAYSPIAGGFLTKSPTFITTLSGRFSPTTSNGIYHTMYNRPAYLAFLTTWSEIASSEHITPAELAYRWIVHHSQLSPEHGDAIVFGASSVRQIEETCGYLRAGPLKGESVRRAEGAWEGVRGVATLNHWRAARDRPRDALGEGAGAR